MIVGVWGGRKVLAAYASSIGPHGFYTSKRKTEDDFQVRLFVANRDLPLFLGIGSMTATWVGGGYLNGTAEAVYKYGIINCHAPIGYAMSLVLGGAFFATKMRLSDSLTMLDPFQTHYGRWSGLLFCVPAVLGEIFWTAAILAALGDTASVIIRVEASYFIIISGSVIFLYTALGGLYSVTYTDALQVATTGLLLWACVPACMSHKAVGTLDAQYTDWIGTVAGEDITQLLDFFLMTALGGIPWQVYFQRVLSCPTVTEAKILSFMAAIGCILLAVPPVLIGVTAKHTNFTIAGYPHSYELNDVDSPRVLPFTIVYLTSGMTAIFGLVSIAAAVMSSADSSMLSASTMITRNVYQTLLRPAATELEVVITLRIMICALGSLSVYMALSVNSVFDLWTLCSDIVYVLLFPQLLCVFYFKETNAYGSVMAFIVGGVFRCLCGEPSMNIPVVVRLPLYDPVVGQRFPFRLLCMVLGLCTLLLGSFVATTIFRRGLLPLRFDVFKCFVKRQPTSHLRNRSIDQAAGTASAAP
nr:high-affinity choline transporter 1-like [Rhipicephalus microplus]